MRVSSLLPLSHCEERERDEEILPGSKTRSPRSARDDGVTKEKARTFPSEPRLAALLFYYYSVFVFHFSCIEGGRAPRRSARLHKLVFNRVGEKRIGRRGTRGSVELSGSSNGLHLNSQDGEIWRRRICIERTA